MELRSWIALALAALLVAGLVVLAAAFLLWRARLRWRRRIAGLRRTAYPHRQIVLVHGILGFDELRLGPTRHLYFRGVAELMDALGAQIHVPRVGGLSTVRSRAQQLAAHVSALPTTKRVNLIAHSMGGLDARYAITHLGLAERVNALITIGTPHRGTALADVGVALLRRLPWLSLDVLEDLSRQGMGRFNAAVENVPEVFYGSVLGHGRFWKLNAPLLPSYLYLRWRAGDNDGLVPVSSQRWGEVIDEVDADHWAQIGWSTTFDAPALFERLLQQLAARGL